MKIFLQQREKAPDGYHLAKLEVRCCLVEGGASNQEIGYLKTQVLPLGSHLYFPTYMFDLQQLLERKKKSVPRHFRQHHEAVTAPVCGVSLHAAAAAAAARTRREKEAVLSQVVRILVRQGMGSLPDQGVGVVSGILIQVPSFQISCWRT